MSGRNFGRFMNGWVRKTCSNATTKRSFLPVVACWRASTFVRKYSVQFANPAGKESRPFYFFEAMHHESAVTWQVTRAEFDKLLIEHAAEQGATVHQGTAVKQVLFDGDAAVGVEVKKK